MINNDELDLLLADLLDYYGYDFTHYSRASLTRRVNRLWHMGKFLSFAALRHRIRTDESYAGQFVEGITVNVTEMFRDPLFYQVLRRDILPTLAAKPFIRIWHAGCSTGEEVYSMSILLSEANLAHKSLLYATDINSDVLDKARKGIFPMLPLKQYAENYRLSGGTQDFSTYYTAHYGYAKFRSELGEKVVFSTHNLVSDGSFNEFDLILCRNVLIYFDKILQEQVLSLFDQSLAPLSYLALGSKETLKFSSLQPRYRQLTSEKIWRKIG